MRIAFTPGSKDIKRLNDMPNEQACATTIDAMNKAFALIGG